MLPRTITLSKIATDKLRMMKGVTGLTPNILARIAIMLAIKDGSSLVNASVGDANGQTLPKDVLFGEYADVYEVLLNQYIHDTKPEGPLTDIIPSLVEAGVHKMGHIKNISDVTALA